MRLAVLLHEQAPERAAVLLERAGSASFSPLVTAVIGAFGRLWKLRSEHDALEYVAAHVAYLEPLLLFELVHEGAPASWMRRIAALGGLESRFERWVSRLASAAAEPGAQEEP
jgi:hypothetical protein